MYKKILCMLLSLTMLWGMVGCGKDSDPASATEPAANQTKAPESTEAALEDDELLDMIGDDLTVVQESEVADTISQMLTQPEQYYGKLYQLTGTCQKKDGAVYIVPAPDANGLRLNYLTQEIQDGEKILVIGVLNTAAEGEKEIVFDTLVAQPIE